MNIDDLLQASTVLSEVSEAFTRMRDEQKKAVIASMQFTLVSLHLLALAKHLQDGMEPYDACLAAIKGDLTLAECGISESQITMYKLLTARPEGE
jgi:hypothetical protein